MKLTDIVKLKNVIVMFKASKNTRTNNIQTNCIAGRKHIIIRNKIRTNRKSFCISIINPKLLNIFII